MDEIVTIAIPAYNVEKYIGLCLESIIKQTYDNLQIIVINDGSTDRTLEICCYYKNKDNRIEVHSNTNKGASYSRNIAIARARGAYICFFDADDILSKDAIENLLAWKHRYSVELSIGGYECIDQNDNKTGQSIWTSGNLISSKDMIRELFQNEKNSYQGYIWNKLFEINIINRYGIRFAEDIAYNEDRLFLVEYLIHCKKVYICNECVYRYRMREGGAMNFRNKEYKSNMISELTAFQGIEECLNGYDQTLCSALYNNAFNQAISLYRFIPKDSEDRKKVRNYVSYFAKSYIFNHACHDLWSKMKIIVHWIVKR